MEAHVIKSVDSSFKICAIFILCTVKYHEAIHIVTNLDLFGHVGAQFCIGNSRVVELLLHQLAAQNIESEGFLTFALCILAGYLKVTVDILPVASAVVSENHTKVREILNHEGLVRLYIRIHPVGSTVEFNSRCIVIKSCTRKLTCRVGIFNRRVEPNGGLTFGDAGGITGFCRGKVSVNGVYLVSTNGLCSASGRTIFKDSKAGCSACNIVLCHKTYIHAVIAVIEDGREFFLIAIACADVSSVYVEVVESVYLIVCKRNLKDELSVFIGDNRRGNS